MQKKTEAAIKQVSLQAAKKVNQLYTDAHASVAGTAEPLGMYTTSVVAAIIEEEVIKVFMVMRLNKKKSNHTPIT